MTGVTRPEEVQTASTEAEYLHVAFELDEDRFRIAAALLCAPDCSFENPWIAKEFPNAGASAVNEGVSAKPLKRVNANYDSV